MVVTIHWSEVISRWEHPITPRLSTHYQISNCCLTTRSTNSQYQILFSLPDYTIPTTNRCLTTRHRILTTNHCLTTSSSNSHYWLLFTLRGLRTPTTHHSSHYQIIELFSPSIRRLTARTSKSHYRSLFSLPDLQIPTRSTGSLFSLLPDQIELPLLADDFAALTWSGSETAIES